MFLSCFSLQSHMRLIGSPSGLELPVCCDKQEVTTQLQHLSLPVGWMMISHHHSLVHILTWFLLLTHSSTLSPLFLLPLAYLFFFFFSLAMRRFYEASSLISSDCVKLNETVEVEVCGSSHRSNTTLKWAESVKVDKGTVTIHKGKLASKWKKSINAGAYLNYTAHRK